MTIPNPSPKIFVPGKIIQVRSRVTPLIVTQLAFVSVEEHVRHVDEMVEWLFPNATEMQRAGAKLHDVGKKVGARRDFLKGLRLEPEKLRADFYEMQKAGNAGLSHEESGQRYVAFAQADGHRRLWPMRDQDGELQDVRMDLDPPFGNHAADATEDDMRPYKEGSLDLEHNAEGRDYVLNLVRLHHSFQPDRIIGACAQHGEVIVTDLYRLIVADHMGSRWAEYVIQQIQAGLEKPEREDFFGDVKVSVAGEAHAQADRDGLKVGLVRLRRDRLPGEQGVPPEKELMIQYHAVEVNWDLKLLAEEPEEKADRESRKRAKGTRR